MVITQTRHKLQPDAEKYGRELREDCSVKRVASAGAGSSGLMRDCRKIDACRPNANRYVFIFRFRS